MLRAIPTVCRLLILAAAVWSLSAWSAPPLGSASGYAQVIALPSPTPPPAQPVACAAAELPHAGVQRRGYGQRRVPCEPALIDPAGIRRQLPVR